MSFTPVVRLWTLASSFRLAAALVAMVDIIQSSMNASRKAPSS
jgi:hypothetical protein